MSAVLEQEAVPRLVDLLIEEQQTLRAVDEFSSRHDAGALDVGRFETLIPGEAPGEGQQYAFAVDLDLCTGCKACVTACHSLNGLEIGETWRRVGVVEGEGGPAEAVSDQQTVTTACHHCESPACLAGCPVKAYEKDPVTGIVVHLDDQCIGCRYCQLTCPYDVPTFSDRLGIVRKCDMCQGRLAAGEAPACVQGCPNEAIAIEHVDVGEATPQSLLPVEAGGLPLSSLTRPTTRYRSGRGLPAELRALDASKPAPREGHVPLVVMLVLTQASVGALAWDQLLAWLEPVGYGTTARGVAIGLASLCGFAGLGASLLHIGRPQWAFRVFLGLRTSWLSREILVFGLFAGALGLSLAAAGIAAFAPAGIGAGWTQLAALESPARILALVSGLAGVFCSMMIYAVTGRPFWRLDRTVLRFGGTALLLGAVVGWLAWNAELSLVAGSNGGAPRLVLLLPVAVGLLAIARLALERRHLVRDANPGEETALARTRLLLVGPLAGVAGWRRGLGAVFGLVLPWLAVLMGLLAGAPDWSLVLLAGASLAGSVVGEIAERSLFFRAEAMPAMPGAG